MFVGLFGSGSIGLAAGEGFGVAASEGIVAVGVVLVTESFVRIEVVLRTDGIVGVIVLVSDGVKLVTDAEGVIGVVESMVGSGIHVCISLCSENPSTHEQT